MGRKRGGKNADTDLKAQEALQAIKSGKTGNKLAEELGVSKNTISARKKRALEDPALLEMIEESRRRNLLMLSRCDDNLHNILTYGHPDNFGNQLRAIGSIYRTFGVWQDQPVVQVNNFIPIRLKIEKEIHTIDLGSDKSDSAS